jgi:hypothetical protein
MKRIDEQIAARTTICASLLLFGCLVGLAAGAAEADRDDGYAACRQETKRVVVWPSGSPKAATMARIEKREVTVCDAQVSRQSKGN